MKRKHRHKSKIKTLYVFNIFSLLLLIVTVCFILFRGNEEEENAGIRLSVSKEAPAGLPVAPAGKPAREAAKQEPAPEAEPAAR